MRQDTSAIPSDQQIRVVIINHDVERATVDAAVRHVERAPRVEVQVIHSGPGDGYIDSFEELLAHTSPGDVAMFHGDDDLMVQGSLAARYQAMAGGSTAVNICKWHDSIVFFRDRTEMFLKPGYTPGRARGAPVSRQVEPGDLNSLGLPFMSAYCYRIGDEFVRCYKQALKWGQDLPVDHTVGLLLLPFYVGVAAWHQRQLALITETLVLRGRVFLSARSLLAPRHMASPANYGIVTLCGLAVLKNSDLRDDPALNALRAEFETEAYRSLPHAWTRWDDAATTRIQFRRLLKLSGVQPRKAREWAHLASGVLSMMKSRLRLGGLRGRMSGWGTAVDREEFSRLWNR